jgi:CHAT domain-containing protein
VLAGCHTGARDPESLTGGLSLGRAFLLAGAEQVLVSDDEVPDTVTSALVAALYELGAPEDLVGALSRAQRRLAAEGIHGTEAFRVLTR